MPAPQEPTAANGDRNLALFCDFENIAGRQSHRLIFCLFNLMHLDGFDLRPRR